MDRGGPTLPFAASPRQQQSGSRRSAPSPPTTRGDGQPRRAPPVPPLATHARGERCGLTVQQQQQQRTSALTPTEHGRLAFSLYRQCVAAGQWARVSVEQRPDGEYITFSSRPSAAAPAAAGSEKTMKPRRRRRRPNQRRVKQKETWMQSRNKRQQSSLPVEATTAAGVTYAQVAAAPASPAARVVAATADPTGSLVPSPRLTRAAKKRKQCSPGDVASTAFAQLDGADATPPSSPPEPSSPEAVPLFAALAATPTAPAEQRPRLQDEPPETAAHPAVEVCAGQAGPEPVNPPSEKEAAPPQEEVVSSFTRKMDALHRETHAGLIVEGCERCSRKKHIFD